MGMFIPARNDRTDFLLVSVLNISLKAENINILTAVTLLSSAVEIEGDISDTPIGVILESWKSFLNFGE